MTDAQMSPGTHCISARHPSLPGHFPGHPVVPGVVILARIIEALERDHSQWHVTGIKKLKFLQPLLPDQAFTVEYSAVKGSTLRFHCTLAQSGERLVEGRVQLTGRGAP